MNRRSFLRGLMATTAAGLLVPERKAWALDQTMMQLPSERVTGVIFDEAAFLKNIEWGFSAPPINAVIQPHPLWWYQVQAMGQYVDGHGWYEVRDGVDVDRV